MSQEIRMDYNAVYKKTAELRKHLLSAINEMESEYRQIVSNLRGMDRRASEAIIKMIEASRRRTKVISEVIANLLSFMDAIARQAEKDELTNKEYVLCPNSSRHLIPQTAVQAGKSPRSENYRPNP